jgi:hypothetical protein
LEEQIVSFPSKTAKVEHGAELGPWDTLRAVIRRLLAPLLGLTLLGVSSPAAAQAAPADSVGEVPPEAPAPKKKPVPWHDSTIIWQMRATTQTLHLGPEPQSRDPFYDWVFYFRPRYYFWEGDHWSLSLRAQFNVSYEFTNSDVTTEQNELTFGDTILSFVPQHTFVENGDYITSLDLSLPRLQIPTSKASFDAGNILGIGPRAYLFQGFPVREGESFLPRARAALRIGYQYQFAQSVVPENPSLQQVRTDANGNVVTNNQLAGAALAQHTAVFHGLAGADIWRDIVAIESEFGIDPAWKFRLPAAPPICGVVLTGCTPAQEPPDPQRYGVVTTLDAYLEFHALKQALTAAIGYENITNQLAPDSQHRNFFWSPDAKLYLRFEFQPDLLLEPRAAPRFTRAPATTNVASAR